MHLVNCQCVVATYNYSLHSTSLYSWIQRHMQSGSAKSGSSYGFTLLILHVNQYSVSYTVCINDSTLLTSTLFTAASCFCLALKLANFINFCKIIICLPASPQQLNPKPLDTWPSVFPRSSYFCPHEPSIFHAINFHLE